MDRKNGKKEGDGVKRMTTEVYEISGDEEFLVEIYLSDSSFTTPY